MLDGIIMNHWYVTPQKMYDCETRGDIPLQLEELGSNDLTGGFNR